MNSTNFITLLGLDELPPEEQESLMLSFADTVSRGALARIIASMKGGEKDALISLIGHGASEAEVTDFLARHAPNAKEVVNEVAGEILRDLSVAIPAT